MAFALFGVKGMKFQTVGLATFSMQLGEPGNGIKFDVVDARVTDDANRTFILGMDVMSGYVEDGKRVMIPWVLDLAGTLSIRMRKVGIPKTLNFELKVLEENTYNPSWDAGWEDKGKKAANIPAASAASVYPPPPPPRDPQQVPWRAQGGPSNASGYKENRGDKKPLTWKPDQVTLKGANLLLPASQLRLLEEACDWRDK